MQMENTTFSFPDGNNPVLLVGEGNFSFAVDLLDKIHNQVIATCFNSEGETSTSLKFKNIAYLRDKGCIVFTDVDATQLDEHPDISRYKFAGIIFNFPHIPGKMKINENRNLIRNFFQSAKGRLTSNGKIYVTLCRGQSGIFIDDNPRKWADSWQIVDLAFSSDLILKDLKPFKPEDFPNYICSGYRGNDKPFNIEGATTFIFTHGIPISQVLKKPDVIRAVFVISHSMISSTTDFQKLRQIEIFEDHPLNKVFDMFTPKVKEKWHLVDKDLLKNFLICTRHKQHTTLCLWTLLDKLMNTCCEATTLNVFINIAIPKLKNNNVFITDVFCLPCHKEPNYFPYFSRYVFVVSTVKFILFLNVELILNSIFIDTEVKIISESFHSEEILKKWNVQNSYDELVNILLKPPSELSCDLVRDCVMKDTLIIDKMYDKNDVFSIVATYDTDIVCGYIVYKNVKISLENITEDYANYKNTTFIGFCRCISYQNQLYYYVMLDSARIAMIRYNIFNEQVLYNHLSFYVSVCNNTIYRPLALHSPHYVHDISFWLPPGGFSKMAMLLFIKNCVGDFIYNIRQIDSYREASTQKQSLCYRLTYCTLCQPLSKEKARTMNNQLRELLKSELNMELR